MAVTKRSFRGQPEEERQDWQQGNGGGYGDGDDCLDMLQNTEGAKASQSAISKGIAGKVGRSFGPQEGSLGMKEMQGPGKMPVPPRALYSAEVGMGVIGDAGHPLVTSGGRLGGTPTGDLHANPASTGKGSLGKPLTGMHERSPLSTGAGVGEKVVRVYGKGGVGGPAGVTDLALPQRSPQVRRSGKAVNFPKGGG